MFQPFLRFYEPMLYSAIVERIVSTLLEILRGGEQVGQVAVDHNVSTLLEILHHM